MAAPAKLDFDKLPADQNIKVAMGPANAIANVNAPTAAELNAMFVANAAIPMSEFDFGIQPSETTNDPTMADKSTYTVFGAAAYGGSIGFNYPKKYRDMSNDLSKAYDLTQTPGTLLFVAIRVDGEKHYDTPFADGDFVHVFLVMTDSEANTLTGADSLKRTIGMLQQSVFSVYALVGAGAAKPVLNLPTVAAGKSARVQAKVLGRVVTNACDYSSSDMGVLTVGRGGVLTGVSAGAATLTVTNPYTNQFITAGVTVTA